MVHPGNAELSLCAIRSAWCIRMDQFIVRTSPLFVYEATWSASTLQAHADGEALLQLDAVDHCGPRTPLCRAVNLAAFGLLQATCRPF